MSTDQILTTRTPWKTLGMSRASFKRLQSAGRAPLPRNLGLDSPRWLISDLIKWAESRPADRRSFKGPTRGPVETASPDSPL